MAPLGSRVGPSLYMGMLESWISAKMRKDTERHDCIQDKLNAKVKSRLKELVDKNKGKLYLPL